MYPLMSLRYLFTRNRLHLSGIIANRSIVSQDALVRVIYNFHADSYHSTALSADRVIRKITSSSERHTKFILSGCSKTRLLIQNSRNIAYKSEDMNYQVSERGSRNAEDYKIYIKEGNRYVSPFHDILLHASPSKDVFNMVVEIPRWTNAKMEISKSDALNPIRQDMKNGKLRFTDNCFPYHGYIWNYGALPQTWEDPEHTDKHTQMKGDNDPVDVCEIGSMVYSSGDVIQVKVLGLFGLIDEGETDWKLIAIDVKDPRADKLNDIGDVEKYFPGLLKETHHWFRIYKVPAGKPENKFAFNGEPKGRNFALDIISQTHEQWKKLIDSATNSKTAINSKIQCVNTTLKRNPITISETEADKIVEQNPAKGAAVPIPREATAWHFFKVEAKKKS